MTNSDPNRYDVVGSFAPLASVPAGKQVVLGLMLI